MAHLSPAVNLIWAALTIMFESFLVYHLWCFDCFKCLKWNHGPRSGTFKRVMTYSYLTSLPLIAIYAMGFSIIKYSYGFTVIPGMGIMPTPYELWRDSAQIAILPLYLCFSVGWALEMVTHLEELCFWLFLIRSSSAKQDWFRSLYFKIWATGSIVAVIYMPLVTVFTRQDPYKCEAYTFLAGSLGSFSLTIWFLPILWTFPTFLESLKQADVDINTMVRLTKFHELNCIRVFFRFLFTVPLLILGIDGVRPHQHINDNMFATDLLGMIASIGCTVSSGITLIIFFPRSIKGEMANMEAVRELRRFPQSNTSGKDSMNVQRGDQHVSTYKLPPYEAVALGHSIQKFSIEDISDEENTKYGPYEMSPSLSLQPNRRTKDGNVQMGTALTLTDTALSKHNTVMRKSNINHLVYNWRSPLGKDSQYFCCCGWALMEEAEVEEPPLWYR
ncbi:uncharacterized protein HD556DRAFT_440570 [Suillus plorans]|uniref:Uncharacterized protein n=1 Tax=Suillus plorans TaxID=116603 RepID=A0A9P7DH55_9AGAM|nr:uncharacterized protein HD556DRAFT_440570 [Suillus plorans]KAG1794128.1 hypothetical protein HD556DRAFT_440570 [Suillus plorans]